MALPAIPFFPFYLLPFIHIFPFFSFFFLNDFLIMRNQQQMHCETRSADPVRGWVSCELEGQSPALLCGQEFPNYPTVAGTAAPS